MEHTYIHVIKLLCVLYAHNVHLASAFYVYFFFFNIFIFVVFVFPGSPSDVFFPSPNDVFIKQL